MNTVLEKGNIIAKIRRGEDLNQIIDYVKSEIYQNGPRSSVVLEIASYFKLFQPEYFKMRLEAMNRQGERADLTCSPMDNKLKGVKSAALLKEETGDGQAQVYRYIRLTELIPELLDLVDEGRIAFRPAVELSYLQKEEQRALLEQIAYADATPSLAQAIKLKRFSQDGKLNNEVIESIMSEEKPNQREKINIKYAEARRFIPASVPYEKTGEYILKALEYYHRYQERQKSRNDAR